MEPVKAYKKISRVCSMCGTRLTVGKILKYCFFDEFIYDIKDTVDKIRMFYICINYERYKYRMIEIGCAKDILKNTKIKTRYDTLKKAEIKDLLNRFADEANNLKTILERKNSR